jgi:branched-subunit amino acid aminotransferase/4-amino-4-deoxychorismate lyase
MKEENKAPKVPIFAAEDLPRPSHPAQAKYFAMYSSLWGGIVTDPSLMQVPVDDHLVHRGDGVFETVKCQRGGLYNLKGHLDRLATSAASIGIEVPMERSRLEQVILETTAAAGQQESLLRLLVSRGPGGFGVDPAESIGAQLYVIAYASPPPFMQRHPEGARVAVCGVPVKESPLATNKTCNYLPNVLMKKAANEAGVHFVVSLDSAGNLTESATENFCLLNESGELLSTPPGTILAGTTMLRALNLARELKADGLITGIADRHFRPEDVLRAREAFVFGTTTHVTAVIEFEGAPVGEGKPGPVYAALSERFEAELADQSSALSTPVPGLP